MKTWQSNTEVTNIWGIQVEMWHKIRLLKENNGTFQTFKKKKYHYGIRKPGVILLGKDLKPVFLSYSAGVVLCQNIRIRNWNTVLEVWINGQNYISSPKRVDNLQNNNKKNVTSWEIPTLL